MYSKILSVCFIALLLCACVSSGGKRSKELINETFITDIKEDGTKLFIYIANFRPPKMSGGRGRGQGRGGQQQAVQSLSGLRSDIADIQERIAIDALEEKLRTSLFCRTGYFILSNYNQFGSIEIRAECQEAATESDLRLFQ